MTYVKLLSAAALLILPLSMPSSSFAAGAGPGPCTRPAGEAVSAEGPAMSGGQLMAGVGDCRHIGSSERPYWGRDRSYGYYDADRGYYRAPGWRTSGFVQDGFAPGY